MDDTKDPLYEFAFASEFFEQEKRDEKRDAENQQLYHDYQSVFSSPTGRRVLLDIVIRGNIYESTFTGNSRGMFLEGERSLALYILNMSQRHLFTEKNG